MPEARHRSPGALAPWDCIKLVWSSWWTGKDIVICEMVEDCGDLSFQSPAHRALFICRGSGSRALKKAELSLMAPR